MKRDELVRFLNDKLEVGRFGGDVSNNGLQIEGNDEVTRIAYGVDASLMMAKSAAVAGAEFVFVHHGLSWGGEPRRLTGVTAARYREFFTNNTSLYAVHLPLDAHPILGHNAQLCDMIGLEERQVFCSYHGMGIGWSGVLGEAATAEAVLDVYSAKLASPPLGNIYGAKTSKKIRRVGIVSGGGGQDAVMDAIAGGLDLLVIGEVSHELYNTIMESGLVVLELGHYASETPGVEAVMKMVERELNLPGVWIDLPTGL